MKPFSRGLAAGVTLIACLLLLLAAVPSQTDFDGAYFKTNALPISLVGTLTNWTKLSTNVFAPLSSPSLTGTPTINGTAISTNWTDTGTNTAARGSVSVPGQMGFTGYTTATLPTGIGVGYQTYCTDCLTPWGTGDRVEWDGSVWRTMRARITATTDLRTYMTYAAAALWDGTTAKSVARTMDVPVVTTVNDLGGTGFLAGAGSGESFGASIAGRNYCYFKTGTTTNGYAGMYAWGWMTNGSEYVCIAADLQLDNLSSDAEIYWAQFGTSDSQSGTTGNNGNYFLYDRSNVNSHNSASTNNWLCVSRKASSNQIVDSGAAVTTDWTRFCIVLNETNAFFYINGTPVATNTTTPTAVQWLNKMTIVKAGGSTGTTSRNFFCDWLHSHIRYATARATFP